MTLGGAYHFKYTIFTHMSQCKLHEYILPFLSDLRYFGIRSKRPLQMAKKKNENVQICAGWWLAVLLWMILLLSPKDELSKEAKHRKNCECCPGHSLTACR